ncbi:MAG: helix-turn-helix domain containing protein [candidate division Zixibacteria bacterium]|nr:helix-turn-helix domain containing protein [candidate division Zixibacteria bacterium]
MSRRVLLSALMLGWFILVQSGSAQESEVTIGEVSLQKLRWGDQRATFEIVNNTEYLKFITVITNISFEGTYLSPARDKTTNFILEPYQTRLIDASFVIPPNFGKATMNLKIYDIVDTLDDLLPSQLILEQPFYVNFRVPEQMMAYLQNKICLPAMVGNSPSFDNEFSRIILLLLDEGKTIPDIAAMAGTDTAVVSSLVNRFVQEGFFSREGDQVKFLFPMIRTPEAEEVKKLAEKISDEMAALIKKNLPAYQEALDSMVAAKILTTDTNYFMHGGSLLYRRYPVIAGLFLWYDLGQEFINRLRPLEIFANTNPCHARIINYMYAVDGGDYFNGTNFYYLSMSRRHLVVTYGDSIPKIECKEGFDNLRQLMENSGWWYSTDMIPETFMMDTSMVHAALRGLRSGAPKILEKAQNELQKIVTKYGQENMVTNTRYWFWNLSTTRILDKLVKENIIQRRGNGLYRFEKLRS